MSLVKYRVKEVAADFGMSTKEILEIVGKYFEKPRSNAQVLTEEQLNALFDHITQHRQIASIAEVYAVTPPAKKEEKPAAPKKEASGREKRSERPQKLRFSFKEQREYETIDADIAALEAQIADCDAEMERCASDYVRLQELTAQKDALSAQLDEKTERWIYLNDLAERIAAQNAQ